MISFLPISNGIYSVKSNADADFKFLVNFSLHRLRLFEHRILDLGPISTRAWQHKSTINQDP